MQKYEYLTGEYLGYKPSVSRKAKFECSLLGMVLSNNTKKNRTQIGGGSKKQQGIYLVYNPKHSFAMFNDIDEFKELSLGSMYKRLNDFQKRFNRLKTVNSQRYNNKVLKEKFLDGVGDFFNELYYIYKDK